MKKRTLKRMLMIIMAFALIAPTVLGAVAVRADEEALYVDIYTDADPDPAPAPDPAPDPDPDPDPEHGNGFIDPVLPPTPEPTPDPPIITPVLKIVASPTSVSFGTVQQGQSATVSFTVTNQGTEGASISWNEVDGDDFFTVAGPSGTVIMPGEPCTFTLTLNTNLNPGSYSGSVVVVGSDAGDQQDTNGVTVTATVQGGPQPHVDSVTITPKSATLSPGGSAQFAAIVRGTDLPSTDVDWVVRGMGSAGTTISDDGYLTIGSDETSGSVGIVATSKVDPNVEDRATVTIENSKTHYVSVKADQGGTVSGGGTVKDGDSVTVYASPSTGYSFKGWYDGAGGFVSNKSNYTITNIREDIALIAKFSRSTVYVSTYSSPEEGGDTEGGGTYNIGSSTILKAKPKNGYYFRYWKSGDTIVSRDREYRVTNLTSDLKVTAYFERNRYNVWAGVSPNNAGAVDGGGAYDPGSNVTLKAYESAGYTFKGWYSNYQLLSASTIYTISNLQNDVSITAVFEQKGAKAYVMTSSAGGGGKITPAVSAPVPAGSNVSYAITPDAGYYISDVKIDGKSIGPVASYAFNNVQADHKIEAYFTKKDEKKGSQSSDTKKDGKPMDEAIKDIDGMSSKEKEEKIDDIVETKQNTDMDQLTGVLQKYNMTPEEAYLHINDAVGDEMFMEAYKEGYIQLVINNDYDEEGRNTLYNDDFIYASKPAVVNLEEVYNSIVTDTEAIGTLEGKSLEMHLDITNMTGITKAEDMDAIEKIAKAEGLAIDNTFDITILKTYDGVTLNVTEMGAEAEFSMKVPDSMKGKGQIKIIHVHEGNAEILENLSTDPNEVRFRTSNLSAFAMTYVTDNSFEAGKITGDQAKIYVDTLNDPLPSAKAPGANKTVVIVLICVIVVCLALVAIVLVVGAKGGKKKGGNPPAPKTT